MPTSGIITNPCAQSETRRNWTTVKELIESSALAFQIIAVAGQDNVVADQLADTLTLVDSTGIVITTTAGSDTITFAFDQTSISNYNGGTFQVLVNDNGTSEFNALAEGTYIDITTTSDTITVSVDLTEATDYSGAAYQVLVNDNGAIQWDASSDLGLPTAAFTIIAVSGQSNVVADSASDTLTLVAGTNMTITTDASTDTVTFASSGGWDELYVEWYGSLTTSETSIDSSDWKKRMIWATAMGINNSDQPEVTATFSNCVSDQQICGFSTIQAWIDGADGHIYAKTSSGGFSQVGIVLRGSTQLF